tara:strand:- start:10593 stop:11339 length:747 start_codon:yes stop_codon:yes gene_type:complete
MIIEAKDLVKFYGLNCALKSFSLNVPKGGVFALLGPNGAGKTTFIKCLLGLINIESGGLKVFGEATDGENFKRKISYLPERFSFHGFYTASQVVELYAKAKDVPSDELKEQVNTALIKAGLNDLKGKKLGEMSKGQRQRVGIACLMVGDTELIILDEPFSGLDPLGIRDLKKLIIDLKNNGKTIFLNSHILSEVESLCDYYAIINKGELIEQGELSSIMKSGSLEEHFYQLLSSKGSITEDLSEDTHE